MSGKKEVAKMSTNELRAELRATRDEALGLEKTVVTKEDYESTRQEVAELWSWAADLSEELKKRFGKVW